MFGFFKRLKKRNFLSRQYWFHSTLIMLVMLITGFFEFWIPNEEFLSRLMMHFRQILLMCYLLLSIKYINLESEGDSFPKIIRLEKPIIIYVCILLSFILFYFLFIVSKEQKIGMYLTLHLVTFITFGTFVIRNTMIFISDTEKVKRSWEKQDLLINVIGFLALLSGIFSTTVETSEVFILICMLLGCSAAGLTFSKRTYHLILEYEDTNENELDELG